MRRLVLSGAMAGALGGCALLHPPPRPAAPATAHVERYRPTHQAASRTRPATGSAAAAARLHPGAPPPEPVAVVGLSQDAVRRLLGAPTAEAREGPGRTWTYQGAGCAVVIGFFYDVTRNGFFALSAHSPDAGDAGACLARIRDNHVS